MHGCFPCGVGILADTRLQMSGPLPKVQGHDDRLNDILDRNIDTSRDLEPSEFILKLRPS